MPFSLATLKAAVILGLLISGNITPAPAGTVLSRQDWPWQNWKNSLQSGEALSGKVWSTREARFITPDRLADDLRESDYVLIGETHDNADHHRLQAWLIDQITVTRRAAVVMEMISLDQAKGLEVYLGGADANAAGLGPAIGWAKRGWPDWSMYRPIADAVFRAGLPLLPGDPSRTTVRKIATEGFAALDKAEQTRLALDRPLPLRLDEALLENIKEGHCGLLPAAALGPITKVQRFRDASLADAMIKAGAGRSGGGNGVILIAGNGHVRTDRAVPWYLEHHAALAKISSLMLLEISSSGETVDDLMVRDPDGLPAADYFWFTPAAEREDQCEKLRRRFEKK